MAVVRDAMNENLQGKVMTLQEVAQYLRCHPSTIYRALKRGELPGFRIGSDWRFNSELIERFSRKEDAGRSKRKQ